MAIGTAKRSKQMHGYQPGRTDTKRAKTSSVTQFTPMMKEEVEERKLLLSMDYGTKTLSLAYRIAKPGEDPAPTNVYDVHFSEQEYHAPQVVAWSTTDGSFYWGHEIKDALKAKALKPEDVIELWKLLLYNDHKTSDLALQVKEQLGSRKLGDLLSAHLKAVVTEAKEQIKRAQTLEFSAEEIDHLPMQLFLSVPQMWKAPANKIMVDAAKRAGVAYVELVYEPQCAAAYFTHNVKDRLPKQLTEGDVMLIADVGGGTGDFVSYECRQDCDAGAKVGLRIIGHAQGALCGSEFVNQEFLKWLKRQVSSFENKCKALGLSTTACIKQASAAFETIKHSFSIPDADPEYVTIRGSQGAKEAVWDVEMSGKEIQTFFMPVIADIVRYIESQMTRKTKVIIVPGGFGRSQYLLSELRQRYTPRMEVLGQATAIVGAYQPVSRGALLRYKDIAARGLSPQESFGIGQVDEFDPVLHPDATYNVGDRMANGRTCRQVGLATDIVENDPYDGSPIVYERWVPILSKKNDRSAAHTFTTETWQTDIIEMDQATIGVQIYWTEIAIHEHEPILTGGNILNSGVRPGIEPWGDPLVKQLPNLASLGFEPIESVSRGMVYEIYWRLSLRCEGANVSVSWEIALPGTEPYDENGQYRDSDVQLTEDQVFTLCNAAHNPTARE